MSKIQLVGRTHDFKGKTLWEIVGNLKNFGVGRVVVRQMFQRYPEPSYMRITKVEALPVPAEGDRKVKVWVEKTFRGRTLEKLVEIHSTSYKTDYLLIPKNKEAEVCRPFKLPEPKILPQTIEFPPLLREFIKKETGQENPLLTMSIESSREKTYRVAKDGETPTIQVSMSLGQPASPNLYKHMFADSPK
ncbi:28S ribosomal protein S34, mitochondrial [Pseudolycoriella hygida]|uniref:28S ribosomal protein S34, mitochondrial n=1 Tax=Pseudolycoriella hygida TaxID=35572 RepID=A0A9Q0S0N3_9DIPT|nr:28S ribosomal protein S34, mitochondrial [Pseudolycoriella hygida]